MRASHLVTRQCLGHIFRSLVLVCVACSAASAAAQEVEWRRAAFFSDARPPLAVELDAASGRLAVGDATGALIRRGDEAAFRRVLRRGPVSDLAFLEDGALLAATGRGLYRIEADGAVSERSPGPGERARRVDRIAKGGGAVAVATADGLYLSTDTDRWQPLRGALPSGAAESLALRRAGQGLELWAVLQGELWRAALRPRPERPGADGPDADEPEAGSSGAEPGGAGSLVAGKLEVRGAERVTLPGAGGTAREVRLDLARADAVVLAGDVLALRETPDGRWRSIRPNLPPGASIHRVAAGAGRLWLASNRGLLESSSFEGPWRRARPPAGSAPIREVVAGTGRVYAASASGLLEGAVDPAARGGAGGGDDGSAPRGEPSVAEVHRAALAYLDLGPERMRRLRHGVERRGWLPVVSLRVDRDLSGSRELDLDETYTSGDYRRFLDKERDRRRSLDVSLIFEWDFGDVLYHRESIDVSEESREVAELRDDVLDEITQLYFERRRVLRELASLPPEEEQEAAALRLRADELAAGLDAWTGGWLSRRIRPLAADALPRPAHPDHLKGHPSCSSSRANDC